VNDPGGLTAPSGLGTALVGGLVTLSWTNAAPSGTAKYSTQVEVNTGTGWTLFQTAAAGVASVATGLGPNASRTWRLRHTFNGFLSAYTAIVADPAMPNAPTGLAANHGAGVAFEQVVLSWTAGDGGSTTEIEQWTGSSWVSAGSAGAGVTSLATGADRSSVTQWRAQHDAGGVLSAYSNIATDPGDMGAPGGLGTGFDALGKVQLTWSNAAPSGTARYDTAIERNDGASWVSAGAVGPGVGSFASGLSTLPGRSWRVRHLFNGFVSGYSAVAFDPPLPDPSGLATSLGTAASAELVTLSWTNGDATAATDIEFWNGSAWVSAGGVGAGVSSAPTGAVRSSTNQWRVRHNKGGALSGYSNTATDPGTLAAPSGAGTSFHSGDKVRVSWTNAAPSGTALYGTTVEASTNGGSSYSTIAGVGPGVSSMDTALVSLGSGRIWRLRHTFNGFSSPWASGGGDPELPSFTIVSDFDGTFQLLRILATAPLQFPAEVERSLDGGTTWEGVGSAGAGDVQLFQDVGSAPPGARLYRARYSTIVGGQPVVGPYSNTATDP